MTGRWPTPERAPLRGKDYCNCDHARMLREGLNKALHLLAVCDTYFDAEKAIIDCLNEDERARKDHEG